MKVLVVGMGGLGCPAALALAGAELTHLGIADDDEVDVTNLHRQILFEEEDVGRSKVEAAVERLSKRAPRTRVVGHATRLLPENALELVSSYDVVIEGSDNFATKFLTSDACLLGGRPVVQGAAVRWHGTALAVGPRGGPCYRCLFEDLPRERAPNCEDAGVVGPVVGVIGAVLADLALRLARGEDVAGTLVTFDGKTMAARRRRVAARPGCALCGARTIRTIDRARYEGALECAGAEA